MTDVTLWLERSPGQDRELRTAEVLRSRVSVRCVPLHPLLPALSDGINYYIHHGVLVLLSRYRKRVARFEYGKEGYWRRQISRSATAADLIPLLPFHSDVSRILGFVGRY